MAVLTSTRQIEVTTPAADQILNIGAISGPSLILAVTATTVTPIPGGSAPDGAQLGVATADASLFFPIPGAFINRAALQAIGTRFCVVSPDLGDPDGNVHGKPNYWAIKYLHGEYVGTVRWKARISFTYVR